MRAFFVAVICSGAILGQAALADPAQPDSTAVPSASAQPVAPAATGAAVPPQAAAAAAETAPATVPQESASSGINLDEIVCKQTAPATGTRLGGGRECHTVRQWNAREKEAQDITRKEELQGFSSAGR